MKIIKPQGPRRIGIADLEERLAVNRTTIWRWYTAGTFPVPHYIGTRRCWWVHDVEAWELGQASQRAPVRPGLLHPARREDLAHLTGSMACADTTDPQ